MVYDTFSFSGEYDILEIRFNLLSPFVDKFILCEGLYTFSGMLKPLFWAERDRDRFEEWENKVVFTIVSDYDDKDIIKQIRDRVDYVDQPAFQRAFYQKESLRKSLEKLNPNDDDIIYYGDCDEMPNPVHTRKGLDLDNKIYKLRQLNYSYFLNNRSSEDWKGTIVGKWKNIKDGCLNDMRAKPEHFLDDGGYHFTNMGGPETIRTKIQSYDHQEVNIPEVTEHIEARMKKNIDFLGRSHDYQGKPFVLWQDESELPEFILNNKDRFIHLWK